MPSCLYLLEIMAGHKVRVLGQILSPCYLGGLEVYWMYCLDWAQVDPQLNAVAAAVVAAELEVETACGFAVGPGQEAHGSSLKENIRHETFMSTGTIFSSTIRVTKS